MSALNLVEAAAKTGNKNRVSYGLIVSVTDHPTTILNEWGLSETKAKEVNEVLTINGNKPFSAGGLTFVRREADALAVAIAAAKVAATAS